MRDERSGHPDTGDSEQLFAQGIAALKAGDRPQARELLVRAIQLNPADDRLWLWLSGAVETDHDRRRCLERVLQINPQNEAARRGLVAIAPDEPAPPAAAPPMPARAADPAPASAAPVRPPDEPAPPAAAPPMPARAADPAPASAAPVRPPDEPAPAAGLPINVATALRRAQEQPPLAFTPAPADAPQAPHTAPEPRSGVLVMADLAKLRSSVQPTRRWRVRPLVLVLVTAIAVIVVLAVLIVPRFLGGSSRLAPPFAALVGR